MSRQGEEKVLRATPSDRKVEDGDAPKPGYSAVLSPEARAALEAGLASAKARPPVKWGDFTKHATDADDEKDE